MGRRAPFFFLLSFLHHFSYSPFQLSVVTIDYVFGSVVNLYVGVEGSIFAIDTPHVATAYLRNAEYKRRVHQTLPPYGSHCTSNGSAYQLTNIQFFVNHREAMAIAVVIFADKHARRLCPFVERVAADILSAWYEILIFLTRE